MKGRDSMGYDGSLKFDTKIDESGFNQGTKKLGSIAKGGLAVLATAVAGCVTAFGALTKASLDSVASLEQNIGGVQTLFKKSADTVIANAEKAYKTAGMSANDYMATVTSFSASLLQSLGQDTEKAASYADRAIVDMSDNANKMGTSMELIQNAYQGFAKQNYTMLDNLKLGYGGTKSEMERLIAKANRVKEANGEMADLSIDSFADVTEAIHIIQTEMGITGTTAAEAASTIEGSMNAAKAALDNFLNGTISVEEFSDAVGIAFENIVKNLVQIVPRFANAVPAAIKQILDKSLSSVKKYNMSKVGLNLIKNLNSGIQKNAPKMISAAADLIDDFASSVKKNAPALVKQGLELVVKLADSVISNIPKIISAGIKILQGLVTGIIQSLPTLISEGPRIINDFASAIYSGLGKIILAGAKMLLSLVQGIWDNRGVLLQNAGQIFLAFINVFSLGNMVSLGRNLINSLKSGINNMASSAVSTLKGVGDRMLNAFKNGVYWSNGGVFSVNSLKNGINAAATACVRALKTIGTNALNAIKSINWRSVGTNIVTGIANGLTASAGAIVTAAKNAAQKALKAAKNFLGIRSPSRRFRDEVGKMMAVGMGEGFEQNVPVDSMEKDIDTVVNNMKKRVVKLTTERPSNTVGGTRNNPVFGPDNSGFDFDEYERRQRKLNAERDNKPVFLGTERIDKKLPKGAVPVW